MKSAFALAVALCLAGCGGGGGGGSNDGGNTDGGNHCQNECTSSGAFRCVGASVESCDLDSQGCLAWSEPVACATSQICQGGQCVTADGGPTCTNACPSSGAVRCVGDSVESCDIGNSGCLEWSSPVACGTGDTCASGVCVSGQTCTNGCTGAGTLRCAGNTIQQCEGGASGCLNWADVSTCNAGQQCSNGSCTSACQAGCSRAGDLRCAGNTIQQCGTDSSGCLNWANSSTCSGSQVCSNGTCASPNCPTPAACTRGALQCAANAVQQCVSDSNGCPSWSSISTCGSGETCNAGQCVSSCVNACPSSGSSQCVGGSIQVCEAGTSGCLAWTTPTACGPGQTCSGGACTASCTNACTANAVRCASDNAGTQTCVMQTTGCTAWAAEQSCGTGSTCSGSGTCSTPATMTTNGAPGSSCTADTQCAGSPNEACFTDASGFPGGYCTAVCTTDASCGAGAICVAQLATDSNNNPISICVASCTSATSCRAGYFCAAEGAQDFCYPKCTSNAECGTGGVCNSDGTCAYPSSSGYPAAFPTPPQVINSGGTSLSTPLIVPIFFSNDDATLVASMKDFYSKVGSSTYWSGLSEYGVGAASSAAPVTIAGNAPTTVNDTITAGSDVWTFIQNGIANRTLPAPTANTVYVINYPAGTGITAGGEQSCVVFGAYHAEADLAGGNVAYAVIPTCAAPTGFQPIQWQTSVASHELVESSTDPFPFTNPAWSSVDAADYFWTAAAGGGEIGDMCVNDPEAYQSYADMGYVAQRYWSNKAAAAGHDPCQPSFSSEVYFNTVPLTTGTVSFPVQNGAVTVNGVSVPYNTSKTITLTSYSDADVGQDWTIAVFDYTNATTMGASTHLGLALSSAQGTNGGTVQLTITDKNATANSVDLYYIYTSINSGTANEQDHLWFGAVGN